MKLSPKTLTRRLVVFPTTGGLAAYACLCLLPTPAVALAVDCTTTTSTSDYNGDGYDDAVVGDPYATVDGIREAGIVTILLGGADGRVGEGRRTLITRWSIDEKPVAGDHFGFDVALGRTGLHDGCADVLVGAPGVDVTSAKGGTVPDAGAAYLVSDLPDTEGTPTLETIPLSQADAKGTPETGDAFGTAVAITGVNQEDRRRLVVGAPGEDAGSAKDAGAVSVFEVDEAPVGLAELRQGRRGPLGAVRLPGKPQSGDRFGSSLAGGRMDLPETSGTETGQALVIGAPGDTVAGRDGAGSVTVLQEKYESAVLISQASAGVPGAPETGDQFGASVALDPATATSRAVLAVGAPREDAGRIKDTGSVTVLDNVGEQVQPRRAFSQATRGVPGTNEAGDRFGSSLAFGHPVSEPEHGTTLLVGVPREDVGSVTNAGAVQPVELAGASPLRFRPALTENAPGTSGSVGTNHRFGFTVSALAGRAEQLLTISSPYAAGGSVYVLSDAADVPARSWVSTVAGGRFGWSVSN